MAGQGEKQQHPTRAAVHAWPRAGSSCQLLLFLLLLAAHRLGCFQVTQEKPY